MVEGVLGLFLLTLKVMHSKVIKDSGDTPFNI